MSEPRTPTPARVRMRFELGGVWVALDALGATAELEREGNRVVVALPSEPDSFSDLREGAASQRWLPSFAPAGPVALEPGSDARTAALLLVEIRVEIQSDFPAIKPAEDNWTDELAQVADADLRRGIRIAEQVAGAVARHLRAAAPHQTWLGLRARTPPQYGLAELEYAATGERILAQGVERSVTFRSSRIRLDRTAWDLLATSLRAGVEPDVARSLLADASHLSDAQATDDQDRAVLVAATACEVYIKQALRDHATTHQAHLVELVLKRRSNLPELVDDPCQAVLGFTMRTDNFELFRQVRALAHQRNALIHSGHRDASGGDVLNPAAVAAALFDWIDSVIQRWQAI